MKEEFTFFWGSVSPFSNWYKCNFTVDDISFNCMEQYMMYKKAKLFYDDEIAQKIMECTDPREHKTLGRKVKDFDGAIWEKHKRSIVYRGCYAKFTQNVGLREFLRVTCGTTLVEASPYDTIWGIGLTEYDPRSKDRKTWRGQNILGEILTQLREDLLLEGK